MDGRYWGLRRTIEEADAFGSGVLQPQAPRVSSVPGTPASTFASRQTPLGDAPR